jgi:uroporphyrinogen decarboxylase
MNKREKMLRLLRDQVSTAGVPAAFFLHFDPSCRAGRAAIEKHKEFFRFTGMDFVKIQLELPFASVATNEPGDWAKLPPLTPEFFEPQLEVVRGLVGDLSSEALVVLTLYSPFMMIAHMGDGNKLAAHLEADPDPVRKALEMATESLLRFVRECSRIGLDGFYHSTQGGEVNRFQDAETFVSHIMPFDLEVMNEVDRTFKFNILHVCDYHREKVGGYANLDLFLEYPGHVVNISPEVGDKTLTMAQIAEFFGRPVMGGMNRLGALATGTEADVRAAAREALSDSPERFVLGADCTVPGDTPWENLKTAIDEAHNWQGH